MKASSSTNPEKRFQSGPKRIFFQRKGKGKVFLLVVSQLLTQPKEDRSSTVDVKKNIRNQRAEKRSY